MPTENTQDGLVEYTFPDEKDPKGKVVAVEGTETKPEVEVVDDTPTKDRGRKPAKEAPAEVTDEELAQYSEAVQKRIKHFSRGYHDERRRAEAAEREREEAIRYAQSASEQNKQLREQLTQGERLFLDQAKKTTEAEISAAEKEYQDAYEAGDAARLTKAQKQLTSAQVTLDRIVNYRPPVQTERDGVYKEQPTQKTVEVPKPDQKAMHWQDDNPWFGEDEEMTSLALGVHEKLVKEGIDPRTDEYYKRVNARMRQVFPDYFEEPTADTPPPQKRAASPVAPATRSTGPKKIRLTQSQVSIAKRLGLTLEQYAKQVADLENR
jgi:hypothetical protein